MIHGGKISNILKRERDVSNVRHANGTRCIRHLLKADNENRPNKTMNSENTKCVFNHLQERRDFPQCFVMVRARETLFKPRIPECPYQVRSRKLDETSQEQSTILLKMSRFVTLTMARIVWYTRPKYLDFTSFTHKKNVKTSPTLPWVLCVRHQHSNDGLAFVIAVFRNFVRLPNAAVTRARVGLEWLAPGIYSYSSVTSYDLTTSKGYVIPGTVHLVETWRA